MWTGSGIWTKWRRNLVLSQVAKVAVLSYSLPYIPLNPPPSFTPAKKSKQHCIMLQCRTLLFFYKVKQTKHVRFLATNVERSSNNVAVEGGVWTALSKVTDVERLFVSCNNCLSEARILVCNVPADKSEKFLAINRKFIRRKLWLASE